MIASADAFYSKFSCSINRRWPIYRLQSSHSIYTHIHFVLDPTLYDTVLFLYHVHCSSIRATPKRVNGGRKRPSKMNIILSPEYCLIESMCHCELHEPSRAESKRMFTSYLALPNKIFGLTLKFSVKRRLLHPNSNEAIASFIPTLLCLLFGLLRVSSTDLFVFERAVTVPHNSGHAMDRYLSTIICRLMVTGNNDNLIPP